MSSTFTVIIPARFDSVRLPHKMLMDVGGLPLIVRTALQAKKSLASRVIVATDNREIQNASNQHGIETIITSNTHQSGTDRIAQAVTELNLQNSDIVINVQGDEPLIDPILINHLADFMYTKKSNMATIAHKITEYNDIFNPNTVKVVLDINANAIYFSRSPIPFYRDGFINKNSHNFKLPSNLNIFSIFLFSFIFVLYRSYFFLERFAIIILEWILERIASKKI